MISSIASAIRSIITDASRTGTGTLRFRLGFLAMFALFLFMFG